MEPLGLCLHYLAFLEPGLRSHKSIDIPFDRRFDKKIRKNFDNFFGKTHKIAHHLVDKKFDNLGNLYMNIDNRGNFQHVLYNLTLFHLSFHHFFHHFYA